jgi:riboflavin synthase alpha subunit
MTLWRVLGASAVALLCAVSMQTNNAALAQGMMQQTQAAPPTVRVRGTITSIDGGILTVKTRDGAEMKLKLADNGPVNEVVKAPISDIKEGSYLAITATPQPDGSQKAMAILIFPPNVHPAEGFSNWDLPNSTMTNATVAKQVTGVDGQTLTVTYKDGEKNITVPSSAEIVTYKKTTAGDLKPGQKIFIFAAKKLPDGMLEAPNISFGDYGVWR